MVDQRFFEVLGPTTLQDLAALTGADLLERGAEDAAINGVAPLDRATRSDVSFFGARRYAAALSATVAGACFVRPDQVDALPPGCAALVVANPQFAYVLAAESLYRPRLLIAGGPLIDPSVALEADVTLGPGVVVGARAQIGRGTVIGANTVIGPGVAIGRDGRIGSNVSIGFALIGDQVKILSNAVIGESGFGVVGGPGGARDIPQLGRVIVQNGVTVGAGTCIDRGAWDDTVIGENTKLDNLVQIAHNVQLGRSCMVAAHTGISGSVRVGDGVRFGGRAGIADHLTIGAGATIMAAAGLMHDVPAGETWGGFPATPARRWLRQVAWLARHALVRGAEQAE